MKIKSKKWIEMFDQSFGWAKSVTTAYDHLLTTLRDENDTVDIELQKLTQKQMDSYREYFKESRTDYLDNLHEDREPRDYFTQEDYEEFFDECGPDNTSYVKPYIAERRLTSFEIRQILAVAKHKTEQAEAPMRKLIADIAWDKSFEIDVRNRYFEPKTARQKAVLETMRWSSVIDPETGDHVGEWVYKP